MNNVTFLERKWNQCVWPIDDRAPNDQNMPVCGKSTYDPDDRECPYCEEHSALSQKNGKPFKREKKKSMKNNIYFRRLGKW